MFRNGVDLFIEKLNSNFFSLVRFRFSKATVFRKLPESIKSIWKQLLRRRKEVDRRYL